jgi:hypothetical protein
MGGMYKLWSKWLGPTVLCCTGLAVPAVAASPLEKATNLTLPRPSVVGSAHNAPLDLRPPPLTGAAGVRFAEFGRLNDTGDDRRLASLGAAMNQDRTSNRTETFIRRFHREGLPLARLWQGHAAVVSLGLNPKGKPGLWLVKQTH